MWPIYAISILWEHFVVFVSHRFPILGAKVVYRLGPLGMRLLLSRRWLVECAWSCGMCLSGQVWHCGKILWNIHIYAAVQSLRTTSIHSWLWNCIDGGSRVTLIYREQIVHAFFSKKVSRNRTSIEQLDYFSYPSLTFKYIVCCRTTLWTFLILKFVSFWKLVSYFMLELGVCCNVQVTQLFVIIA